MTTQGLNVLLVDDNSMNRRIFTVLLKSMGSMVEEAASGEACLERIKDKKYDIIFMDHMMPGLDGVETFQKMQEMEESLNKDTPVIALSADSAEEAANFFRTAGFNGYLEKPVLQPLLEKMIMEL